MKNLLIVLCLSPFQHELVDHTINITKATIKKEHKVSIFLFMDGVYNIMDTQEGEPFKLTPYYEQFKELTKLGVNIKICKLCKMLRGINDELIPNKIEAEGIAELNELILKSDKVISFIR